MKPSGDAADKNRSILLDAAKTLLANIRFASIDEEVKTIVVTSSMTDEGKSTVALNLALALASSGKNTLLVDADMRRRTLAHSLDIHMPCGIYAAVSGASPLNEAICRTRVPRLYFMDSEPDIPSPPDILGTKSFASLVKSLDESFDAVVFDTPPVSLFVDAAIISSIVDGTLFLIRQGSTKRAIAEGAVQQLRQANARLLGVVVTFTRNSESNYYYKYYNNNNNGRKKRKKAAGSLA
jgi:capsular exopolysaccharide synthesis family protein